MTDINREGYRYRVKLPHESMDDKRIFTDTELEAMEKAQKIYQIH
jgi:hypothetical protein